MGGWEQEGTAGRTGQEWPARKKRAVGPIGEK